MQKSTLTVFVLFLSCTISCNETAMSGASQTIRNGIAKQNSNEDNAATDLAKKGQDQEKKAKQKKSHSKKQSDVDSADGDDGNDDPDSEIDVNFRAPRAKFGMLVNNLECGFCHVTVRGDVLSTSPVETWSGLHGIMYNERVEGRWIAAQSWSNKTELGLTSADIQVSEGVEEHSQSKALPADLDGDGLPDFPLIDFGQLAAKMRGRVEAGTESIDRVHQGNAVLIGNESAPIQIDKDVLIEGDLVIKGSYQGRGTIYVTGNIYIPHDIKAMRSAFPYPAEKSAALKRGKELAASDETDALGLAAGGGILVGGLRTGLYDMPNVPAGARRGALQVDRVYSWYPGGASGYSALYEGGGGFGGLGQGSFNLVEAFIYARKAVAGKTHGNSYAINGGMITDIWHMLGSSGIGSILGGGNTNPVHGYSNDRNHINYDYRMAAGLPILEALAPYFPTSDDDDDN